MFSVVKFVIFEETILLKIEHFLRKISALSWIGDLGVNQLGGEDPSQFSARDERIRKTTILGCFVFDQLNDNEDVSLLTNLIYLIKFNDWWITINIFYVLSLIILFY